jgi:hypothetical protein
MTAMVDLTIENELGRMSEWRSANFQLSRGR